MQVDGGLPMSRPTEGNGFLLPANSNKDDSALSTKGEQCTSDQVGRSVVYLVGWEYKEGRKEARGNGEVERWEENKETRAWKVKCRSPTGSWIGSYSYVGSYRILSRISTRGMTK